MLITVEEEQGNAVFAVHFTLQVTRCTLLTIRSAAVLKVFETVLLEYIDLSDSHSEVVLEGSALAPFSKLEDSNGPLSAATDY